MTGIAGLNIHFKEMHDAERPTQAVQDIMPNLLNSFNGLDSSTPTAGMDNTASFDMQ